MNRELQNMNEESLQNLEEIVVAELLTVEHIKFILKVSVPVHIKVDQILGLTALFRNGDIEIPARLIAVHPGEQKQHPGCVIVSAL